MHLSILTRKMILIRRQSEELGRYLLFNTETWLIEVQKKLQLTLLGTNG